MIIISQSDHSPESVKFPDNPLHMCSSPACIKWQLYHAPATSIVQTIKFTMTSFIMND